MIETPLVPASKLPDGVNRKRRYATYASVVVATILILAKLAAYLLTDAVTMLSSLLDSTIDLIASLVTVFGVATALQPPDHDHRFGHAKAEPLAALAQAAFIIGSAVFLGYEAIDRLYAKHEVRHEFIGYAVMGLAIAMTAGLIAFQRQVIRQTGSMAISADRLHYTGDLALNLTVIVSLGLSQITGITWFDPMFAMLIAGGLSVSAYRIARDALHVLMDKELPDAQREHIKIIAARHPAVHGMHDLRTRTDGDRLFVYFHIELDGDMTVTVANKVVAELTQSIQKEFPGADIIIHQDPIGLDEVRLDEEIENRSVPKSS